MQMVPKAWIRTRIRQFTKLLLCRWSYKGEAEIYHKNFIKSIELGSYPVPPYPAGAYYPGRNSLRHFVTS